MSRDRDLAMTACTVAALALAVLMGACVPAVAPRDLEPVHDDGRPISDRELAGELTSDQRRFYGFVNGVVGASAAYLIVPIVYYYSCGNASDCGSDAVHIGSIVGAAAASAAFGVQRGARHDRADAIRRIRQRARKGSQDDAPLCRAETVCALNEPPRAVQRTPRPWARRRMRRAGRVSCAVRPARSSSLG